MGTPDFAVPTLLAIVADGHEVVGVVTAPDKPAGRGLKLSPSPVKECAEKLGLLVLQPEKLKSPEFIDQIKKLSPDLAVVVAFRMLPEQIWALPHKGTLNLHASLLPDYRGAAPINHALINGEKTSGLTTFFIEKEIDTGAILLQERIEIDPEMNAGALHDLMMVKGAELVVKTLHGIEHKSIEPIPQIQKQSSPLAPKIFKEDCKINWNQPVEKIHNFVLGLSPYPTSWTLLDGKILKIYSGYVKPKEVGPLKPGDVVSNQNTFLAFCCTNGFFYVKELQLEGKKRMDVQSFLRGYSLLTFAKQNDE